MKVLFLEKIVLQLLHQNLNLNVFQGINVLVEYALITLVRMTLMMKMIITKLFLEL